MIHFSEFLKTWSLRSNSVTRQVNFNRTKIGGKCQVFFCLLCKKSIVEEKSHSINHKAVVVVIQACIFITTLDTVCNNIAINVRLLSWEEHKKEETTSRLLNRLWIGSTRIPYSALYCKRGYRRSLRWWCLHSLWEVFWPTTYPIKCALPATHFRPKIGWLL